MTVRPFLDWPDRRLRTPVPFGVRVDDATRAIWADMIDTMYAMPGVGLAAPQIGVMQALAVVDCSDDRDSPVRMADPTIIWASDEMAVQTEGSPNLPGQWAKVSRPSAIRVRFVDHAGEVVEQDYRDLWATSVQHQVDHLAGRMFFDRLSATKRRMIIAKHEKKRRREAST